MRSTVKKVFSAPKRFWRRIKHLAEIERTHVALVHDIHAAHHRMNSLDKVLRSVTDIHADIRVRDKSTVIVIGRFRGGDYIQTYHFNDDLSEIVDHLRHLQRRGVVRQIDAVPQISDMIKNDLNW